MWTYWLLGIGLFLVLEGIFPFLSPDQYKDYLRKLLDLPANVLRYFGLASMLIGVLIIVLVHFLSSI